MLAKRLFEFDIFIVGLAAGAALVLTPARLPPRRMRRTRTAAPGSVFRDCPACPEMVVIPAGQFTMGSPLAESGHQDEKPQHPVKIAKPFAVSKFELRLRALGCLHRRRALPEGRRRRLRARPLTRRST